MSDTEPEIVQQAGVETAVITAVLQPEGIAEFYDRAFSALPGFLAEQGVQVAGPAFALYHEPPVDVFDLEVGFPVDRRIREDGDVAASALPEGRVARLVHVGGYDTLGESWTRLSHWVVAGGHEVTDTCWEVYLTEPSPEADPADTRTELNWLLA